MEIRKYLTLHTLASPLEMKNFISENGISPIDGSVLGIPGKNNQCVVLLRQETDINLFKLLMVDRYHDQGWI